MNQIFPVKCDDGTMRYLPGERYADAVAYAIENHYLTPCPKCGSTRYGAARQVKHLGYCEDCNQVCESHDFGQSFHTAQNW